jgi:hypothetical protein
MEDYVNSIQIKITDRMDPFGYGLPDSYNSVFINVNGDIKPSEVIQKMKYIITTGETWITGWHTIEEKYIESNCGASGNGFDYLLTIGDGIVANLITEILKTLWGHLRKQEDKYEITDALRDCHRLLQYESQLKKKDITLLEQSILKDEYIFIFKNKQKRLYHIIRINRNHDITYYRVCRSLKEARQ